MNTKKTEFLIICVWNKSGLAFQEFTFNSDRKDQVLKVVKDEFEKPPQAVLVIENTKGIAQTVRQFHQGKDY